MEEMADLLGAEMSVERLQSSHEGRVLVSRAVGKVKMELHDSAALHQLDEPGIDGAHGVGSWARSVTMLEKYVDPRRCAAGRRKARPAGVKRTSPPLLIGGVDSRRG